MALLVASLGWSTATASDSGRVIRQAGAGTPLPERVLHPERIKAGRLDSARMRKFSPAAARNLAGLLAHLPPAAQLSVWNGLDRPPSEFFQLVAGPVTADRLRENLNWYFQYETALKPASAIYQVSVFPFATDSDSPLKVPGLVAQGAIPNVPKNGGRALFTVDFAPIVRGRPWAELRVPPRADRNDTKNPARAVKLPVVRPETAARPARTELRPDLRRGQDLRVQPGLDPGLAQVRLRAPTLHTGYYVRVVLKNASGGMLGRPSNAVRLAFEQLPLAEEIELVMGSHPPVRFAGYRPVQPDDWAQLCLREYIGPPGAGILGGAGMFQPGQVFDACAEQDEGLLEELSDGLGDFFGALGDLVDSVGAVYEWAKSQAVALAATMLDELGLPCPCPIGSCEDCLSAALDYGLASLGIPPSLPSFDELLNEGVDYIAVTIAAETGLPVAEATAIARELAKTGTSDSAPGTGDMLWRPLPQHLYAPLVLKLRVGPGKWPVNLVVEDPSGRYQRALVPVPALTETIVIPIALQPIEAADAWRKLLPTLDSLPQGFNGLATWLETWVAQMNLAAAELERWRQRYRGEILQLQISSLSAIGSGWSRQQQLSLRCSTTAVQCAISD